MSHQFSCREMKQQTLLTRQYLKYLLAHKLIYSKLGKSRRKIALFGKMLKSIFGMEIPGSRKNSLILSFRDLLYTMIGLELCLSRLFLTVQLFLGKDGIPVSLMLQVSMFSSKLVVIPTVLFLILTQEPVLMSWRLVFSQTQINMLLSQVTHLGNFHITESFTRLFKLIKIQVMF